MPPGPVQRVTRRAANRNPQRFLLCERFLYLVLSDFVQPGRDGRNHRLGSMRLRDRDNPDFVTMPTSNQRGANFLSHFGDPFWKGQKLHNMIKYSGLRSPTSGRRDGRKRNDPPVSSHRPPILVLRGIALPR